MHAFGDAEALQQFREQGDRLKIGAEIAVSFGHDIAGDHERIQFAEAGMQCRAPPSFRRAVDDIVNHQ